jgi:hypothetical protein
MEGLFWRGFDECGYDAGAMLHQLLRKGCGVGVIP